MRLEFSYRDHVIRLLSSPWGEGWLAKFEVQHRIGDKEVVHVVSDTPHVIHATLHEANRSAKKLATTWVDQRSHSLRTAGRLTSSQDGIRSRPDVA